MKHTDHCTNCAKCRRAFERTFWKSLMPLIIKHKSPTVIYVKDVENGSGAEYDVSGDRIRLKHYDEATL